MNAQDIEKRLIKNDSLFRTIYVFEQKFNVLPESDHIGSAVDYQDIRELKDEFLDELVDTVIDFVYSNDKYKCLQEEFEKTGKTPAAAASQIRRKATQKFRKSDDYLLIQGQLGELLLFHYIQKIKHAAPLLRKMPITTSAEHERFGADAIHYKIEDNKNILILGEAKAYTSKYSFKQAFENSLSSIIDTYKNFKKELNLYMHEDFLDRDMDNIAELFLTNRLPNVRIELMSVILFNETTRISLSDENDIKKQIRSIITDRVNTLNIDPQLFEENPILNRITYVFFPVWEFEKLAQKFQNML